MWCNTTMHTTALWNRCTNRKSNFISIGRNEKKIHEYPIGNVYNSTHFCKKCNAKMGKLHYQCIYVVELQVFLHATQNSYIIIVVYTYEQFDTMPHQNRVIQFMSPSSCFLSLSIASSSLFDSHSIHVQHWQSMLILDHTIF